MLEHCWKSHVAAQLIEISDMISFHHIFSDVEHYDNSSMTLVYNILNVKLQLYANDLHDKGAGVSQKSVSFSQRF